MLNHLILGLCLLLSGGAQSQTTHRFTGGVAVSESVQFITSEAIVLINYTITVIKNESITDEVLENSLKQTSILIFSTINKTVLDFPRYLNGPPSLSEAVYEYSTHVNIDNTMEMTDIQSAVLYISPSFTEYSEPITHKMTDVFLVSGIVTMVTANEETDDYVGYKTSKFITSFSSLVSSSVVDVASSINVSPRLSGLLTEEVFFSSTIVIDSSPIITESIVVSTYNDATKNTPPSDEKYISQSTTKYDNIVTQVPTPDRTASVKTTMPTSSLLTSTDDFIVGFLTLMTETTLDAPLKSTVLMRSSSLTHLWQDIETVSQYHTLSTINSASDTSKINITSHGQGLRISPSTTVTPYPDWPTSIPYIQLIDNTSVESTNTSGQTQEKPTLSIFSTQDTIKASPTSDFSGIKNNVQESGNTDLISSEYTTQGNSNRDPFNPKLNPSGTDIGEFFSTENILPTIQRTLIGDTGSEEYTQRDIQEESSYGFFFNLSRTYTTASTMMISPYKTVTLSPVNTAVEESVSTFSPANTTVDLSASTFSPADTADDQSAPTFSPADTADDQSAPTFSPADTTDDQSASTFSPAKITSKESITTFGPANTTNDQSITTFTPTNTTTKEPITTFTTTNTTSKEPITTFTPTNTTTKESITPLRPTNSSTQITTPYFSTRSTTWSSNSTHKTTTSIVPESTTISQTVAQLEELFTNTSDPRTLTAVDVTEYAEKVLKLYNESLSDLEVARDAFLVIGNLGDVNVSVSEQAEEENQTNSKLRAFLDNYTAEVDLETNNGVVNISTPQLQVLVLSLGQLDSASSSTSRFDFEITDRNSSSGMKLNVTVTFPPSLLHHIYNNSSVDNRIQFVTYTRSQLFVPAAGFPEDLSTLDHQRVVSASIKGKHLANLTEPIAISLPVIRANGNHDCVYWNIEESQWSTDGIILKRTDNYTDHVTCLSSHLTSFAVILNHKSSPLTHEHEAALTYLTYIGCGISMTGLIITIITFTLFQSLNQEKTGKILVNLCSALLLLNIVFLVATVDVSGFSDGGCLVVGMLMHYLVLASLMWMLVEAEGIYRALVIVFIAYGRFHLLKRCLVAWGVPLLIVGITAAVSSNVYFRNKESSKYCLMTSISTGAFYASLVAPACVIILVNIAVFIRVARIIFRPNIRNQLMPDKRKVTPSQVRGAVTLVSLLGITWVFGPLAIGDARTAFNFLFCICNSFQGCAIFVFRCLCNKDVRQAWLCLFRHGTLKSRRWLSDSAASDFIGRADDRRYSSGNTSNVVGDSSSRKTSTSTMSSRHDSCSLPQHHYTGAVCRSTNTKNSSESNSEAILRSTGVSLSPLPTKFRRVSANYVADPLVRYLPRYNVRSPESTSYVNNAYERELSHL